MRIFHISDLHIGKQLHDYSLEACQKQALEQIVKQADRHRPDVILIAGDVYDKAVPSGEAYTIFDTFLTELAKLQIPVCIIAGNHDNAQRLRFASEFLAKEQIYIAVMPPQKEEEHLQKITLQDAYGPVHIYLLPFTRPGYVRKLFADGTVTDYHTAVQALLDREQICTEERNVLVAHQYFVSQGIEPEKSDSELTYLSIGGLDAVDVACVRKFDYVALGHIHRAQRIGADSIRYSGTPYKYSVSEEHDKKGITMITLGEKGTAPEYEHIPIVVKPDVRSIRGSLQEILQAASEKGREDYVQITLTDETIFHAKEKLEEVYPHILEVRVDNARTRKRLQERDSHVRKRSPMEAFADFYREINDMDFSAEEEEILREVMEEAKEAYVQGGEA